MTSLVAAKSVTVFGGGVAGLTAAHELAERGFRVLVVEPALRSEGERSAATPFALEPAEQACGGYEVEAGQAGTLWLPGSARHLADTLARIPVVGGQPGRSVLDQLVVGEMKGQDHGAIEPLLLLPEPATTASELYQQLQRFLGHGLALLDLQILLLRVLRYLSSSAERREKECGRASLLDFLSGRDSTPGLPGFRFSDGARRRIDVEARLLTRLDAEHVDARSLLDAIVQLHAARVQGKAPALLAGSIERSWLRHWRAHLLNLGVVFVRGALQALHATAGGAQLRPRVDWHEGAPADELYPSNYWVVATDVVTAERSCRALRATAGVPDALQGYTTVLSGDPRAPEHSRPLARDPGNPAEIGIKAWDRLRFAPYVEFFLPHLDPALSGCSLLVGTKWSLSCLAATTSAQLFDASGAARDVSVLKVTVNGFVPDSVVIDAGNSQLEGRAFAIEIWRQLEAALTPPGGRSDPLPQPLAYRLDERLLCIDGVITKVEGAWLAPVAADWGRRPEGEATMTPKASPQQPSAEKPWSAVGYPVHDGGLVFAGSYLRTWTRLHDAESANESARHAVNALLAHISDEVQQPADGAQASATFCRVFHPEEFEPSQLAPLRQLDRQLLARGLPHIWDLVGVELLPRLASQQEQTRDPLLTFLEMLEGFATRPGASVAPFADVTPQAAAGNVAGDSNVVLDALRNIRTYLEHLASGRSAPPQPNPPRQ